SVETMVRFISQYAVMLTFIHPLLGASALAQSRFSYSARRYLRVAGGFTALLWLFGLLVDPTSMANFVPLNAVDTWTYLVLAIALIGLSFLPSDVTHTKPQGENHLRTSALSWRGTPAGAPLTRRHAPPRCPRRRVPWTP